MNGDDIRMIEIAGDLCLRRMEFFSACFSLSVVARLDRFECNGGVPNAFLNGQAKTTHPSRPSPAFLTVLVVSVLVVREAPDARNQGANCEVCRTNEKHWQSVRRYSTNSWVTTLSAELIHMRASLEAVSGDTILGLNTLGIGNLAGFDAILDGRRTGRRIHVDVLRAGSPPEPCITVQGGVDFVARKVAERVDLGCL